ncbi:hypothetical protein GCM10027276_35760 [Comamonas piscis]
MQDDRLVLAQHFARSDAEQQGITDLTSGTGDGDTYGLLAHGITPENRKEASKQASIGEGVKTTGISDRDSPTAGL